MDSLEVRVAADYARGTASNCTISGKLWLTLAEIQEAALNQKSTLYNCSVNQECELQVLYIAVVAVR